jgi:secreted trypsin-like serine protease
VKILRFGNPHTWLRSVLNGMAMWETVWQLFKKSELLYDPEISQPGIYLRELKTQFTNL